MEIYGTIKLLGSLADGTGDPLLTKDSTTDEVGTAANALGTLNSANIFVGNASNVPVGVAMSGDISITNAGVAAIVPGVIVNADINASAGIAVSKLAALTASRAVATDGSGFLTAVATTATELGYVSGVTSAVQTQIDGKQATITGAATTITSSNLTANRAVISNSTGKIAVSTVTDTELGHVGGVTSAIQTQLDAKLQPVITSVAEGDILYYNGTNWVNFPRGTNGQALYSTATSIQWDTPTINGIPVGGTAGQVLAKQSSTDFDAIWSTLTVSSITDLTASATELNILDGATLTVTELNYVDGVTSPIQTQIDGKLSSTLPQNAIFVGNSSNVATALAGGTNGYVLTSVSGVPTWAAISAGSPPGSDTQVIFNDVGSFAGDAEFVYDKTSNVLTVGSSLQLGSVSLAGNKTISAINASGTATLGISSELATTITCGGNLNITNTGGIVQTTTSAGTNITAGALVLKMRTSGTAAAGFGTRVIFDIENASGFDKRGSEIEVVSTDLTNGTEDFDLVFKTMAGGAAAAERMRVKSDGSTVFSGPAVLPSYTVAGAPSAASYTGGMIYVSNESGGAIPAFSDGTNWRRVTDRAIIS